MPLDSGPGGGGEPPRSRSPRQDIIDRGLPKDCPVKPLGVSGSFNLYRDKHGTVQVLSPTDHDEDPICKLFGDDCDYLVDNWGAYDKDGNLVGILWDIVVEILMVACGRKGIVNLAPLGFKKVYLTDDGVPWCTTRFELRPIDSAE